MNKKVAICPVSFIGDKIKTDTDLNSQFILPYKSKLLSDAYRSLAFDKIKAENYKKYGHVTNSDFSSYTYQIRFMNNNATIDAITSYLVQNIHNIIIQTLLRFTNDAFGIKLPKSQDIYFKFMNTYINDDRIYDVIINSIRYAGFDFKFKTQEQAFTSFICLMDSVFAKTVAMIFDRYITNIVMDAGNSTAIEELYQALYIKCYGHESDMTKETPEFIYNFCTGILREIMNPYLIEYNKALGLIARTASDMIFYNPDYFDNTDNPKQFNTFTMIENNPVFKHCVKIKKIGDDGNGNK